MIKNNKWTITILLISLILWNINISAIYAEKHYSSSTTGTCSIQTFTIELLPWEEVKKLIPLYSKFEVIDIASGQSFYVQRRAGRYHADVQPLTVADTKIMKEVYNGSWSWDRKAVIIQVDGRLIAASMHGMPHGAGALQNNFPGHFCIHFYGSKTHIANKGDLAHQLMVQKAAGRLEQYLHSFSAKQVIDAFLVAIDQADKELLKLILSDDITLEKLEAEIHDIEDIKRVSSFEKSNPILVVEEIIDVSIYSKTQGRKKETILMVLRKGALTDPWKISAITFGKENR